jgi:hypothetical protein
MEARISVGVLVAAGTVGQKFIKLNAELLKARGYLEQ